MEGTNNVDIPTLSTEASAPYVHISVQENQARSLFWSAGVEIKNNFSGNLSSLCSCCVGKDVFQKATKTVSYDDKYVRLQSSIVGFRQTSVIVCDHVICV